MTGSTGTERAPDHGVGAPAAALGLGIRLRRAPGSAARTRGTEVGLTSAGMASEAAIAAVLLYRISTYYLPPLWGFPAMLWLQRKRYL